MRLPMKLKGKKALVTGGSGEIGRAICLALAGEGAEVVVHYHRDKAGAEKVAAAIGKLGGQAAVVQAAVEDYAGVEKMVAGAGEIDILVNNAGIIRDKFLMTMPVAEWDEVLRVNLSGIFNCCKAVSRQMIARRSGKIVNISSVSAFRGAAGQASYAASKAGIEGLTHVLVKELSRYNIYVNTIAPGFIESERVNALPDDLRQGYLRLIPLNRFGRPDEVAKTAVFLASDDSSYIQGQTIIADGGMTV
jgi:3-oxoacyl-[acyl-carrier protein] reductase